MPTKAYYLAPAQTDSMAANGGRFFRNFRLYYQGQERGRFTPAEPKAGHKFTLPDGRRLLVCLQQKRSA